MKRKKKLTICILIIISIVVLLSAVFLARKNVTLKQNKIQIIDATYACSDALESFYEDDTYVYSFPCIMSNSVYVKFPNGNKILVVRALEEKLVTIDELISAGLNVYKSKK